MSDKFSDKLRFCDVVMKGGITSGVVYPQAITKLAERFRFKNIGGTSAGAIAAAAAAAAELSRDRGGFERLSALSTFLMEKSPDGSRSNLSALFQPQPSTSRIFCIALAGLGGGTGAVFRVLIQTLQSYFLIMLLGALPGVMFLIWALNSGTGPLLTACEVFAGLFITGGIAAAVVLAFIFDLTHGLTDNFYGLCSGMTADFFDVANAPPKVCAKPLTYWLTEYLNAFIRRNSVDPPLTFGNLWGSADPAAERIINLEMMTTCLTHGRPYRLPFRDDDDIHENRLFYFRPDEFERLFPKSVVEWMKAHPRPMREADGSKKALDETAALNKLKEAGFLPLPSPADLPVVVAVRMSLSFPVLLSAVPLHAVDRSRDPDGERPERCWFTDGGVCSNFPIHFFDSPLPRWPTLSINLIEKPEGTPSENLLKPEMPPNNSSFFQESWNRFEQRESFDSVGARVLVKEKGKLRKLSGFIGAFITTMQNWTDNAQSRLPGYRDRIARVGLTPDEGGLNLNMPPERIRDLTDRGEAAADEFIARFDVPSSEQLMNWENHRWLRLRSCLASLEVLLARFERGCAQPQTPDVNYEEWVARDVPGTAPSYQWINGDQRDLALHFIRELRALATVQAVGPLLSEEAPRPRPEMRPRPQL